MTVHFMRTTEVGNRTVEFDGDGEVGFEYAQYDSWGGSSSEMLYMTVEELEQVLEQARAHRDAYQAYRDNGFEEVE